MLRRKNMRSTTYLARALASVDKALEPACQLYSTPSERFYPEEVLAAVCDRVYAAGARAGSLDDYRFHAERADGIPRPLAHLAATYSYLALARQEEERVERRRVEVRRVSSALEEAGAYCDPLYPSNIR